MVERANDRVAAALTEVLRLRVATIDLIETEYPNGSAVTVHHSRGSFAAVVVGVCGKYGYDLGYLIVRNATTSKVSKRWYGDLERTAIADYRQHTEAQAGGTEREAPAASPTFNGTAQDITKRLTQQHGTPASRVKKRHEIADACRHVLAACIGDIRARIRETPGWAPAYSSAITAIEIRIAELER